MVIRLPNLLGNRQASLMTELLVAMAILAGVMMPLAWSISSERRLARSLYQRAVAMEIVDGELETLLAGEWRAFQPGQHEYSVRSVAATNLPPGAFLLTIRTNLVRLEWQPQIKGHRGAVMRESLAQ